MTDINVPEDASNRRSLKNILVNPKKQLRFSLILVTGSSLTVVLFLLVVVFQMKQTLLTLGIIYRFDLEIVTAMQSALTSAVYVSLLLTAMVTFLSVLVGIRLSHRIYGPMVAINRHLSELAGGDYKRRVTLRKDDDFLEIQDSLNALAEALEKRHPK